MITTNYCKVRECLRVIFLLCVGCSVCDGEDLLKAVQLTKINLRQQTDKVRRIEYDEIDTQVASDAGELRRVVTKQFQTLSTFGQHWVRTERLINSPEKRMRSFVIRNANNEFEVEESPNESYRLTRARVAESWIDFSWPRDGAICLTPILSLDWLLKSKESEIVKDEVAGHGRTIGIVYRGETERKITNGSQVFVQLDQLNRIKESSIRFSKEGKDYKFLMKYEYDSTNNLVPISGEFRRQMAASAAFESFGIENIRIVNEGGDPKSLLPSHYGISQKAVDAMSGVLPPPVRFNFEFWIWILTAVLCTFASIMWGRSKLRHQ